MREIKLGKSDGVMAVIINAVDTWPVFILCMYRIQQSSGNIRGKWNELSGTKALKNAKGKRPHKGVGIVFCTVVYFLCARFLINSWTRNGQDFCFHQNLVFSLKWQLKPRKGWAVIIYISFWQNRMNRKIKCQQRKKTQRGQHEVLNIRKICMRGRKT